MMINGKHNTFYLSQLPLYLTLIITLIIGLNVVKLQKKQLSQLTTINSQNYLKQEEVQKTRLNLLKNSPSWGFDNLIASFTFLDFVQYFGDYYARKELGSGLTPDYFEVIVKHDPHFVGAYLNLAPATTMFAGQPQKTVAIMSEGLESLTPELDKSYLVWTYKGVDELLFLGDKQAAQNSYATGAEWATYHTDKTSQIIGNRAKETAQFLATNPDSKKAQASSWMMIFSNARDQETRRIALQQIKSLGGEVIVTKTKITVKMPEDNQV
ncbi:MAG: hypothetical protein ACRC1Z_26830 [Waterburya sp.]